MFKLIPMALIGLISFVAPTIAADKLYGSETVQVVTSIYDADTFRVDIKGWPPIIGKHVPIRANGFDAPEMRGKCQKEKDQARLAKQLTVQTLRDAKVIELRNMKRGKYFRVIADVYVDGKSLKDIQVKSGLSRLYSGGKRLSWCD
jgi:micrococcal nuclease